MNEPFSASIPGMLDVFRVDDVDPVVVGPGCLRRDLPGPEGLRVWMVDMAPGSVWPVVDEHDTGEAVYVVAGEVIEDDRRFGMGTYLYFRPGSRHKPRTEKRTVVRDQSPQGQRRRCLMLKKLARLWTGSLHPNIRATDAEPQCPKTGATAKGDLAGSAHKESVKHGHDWRPRVYW